MNVGIFRPYFPIAITPRKMRILAAAGYQRIPLGKPIDIAAHASVIFGRPGQESKTRALTERT